MKTTINFRENAKTKVYILNLGRVEWEVREYMGTQGYLKQQT
jgi:hypothetical protein